MLMIHLSFIFYCLFLLFSTDFIPKILEDGINKKLCDELRLVTGASAIATALRLAAEEGIFTGNSGGATVATALEVAATAPKVQRMPCGLCSMLKIPFCAAGLEWKAVRCSHRCNALNILTSRTLLSASPLPGLGDPGDASRHGRALPLHAALCRHPARNERGRTGAV
jgi:hypothetical protein